MTADPWTPLPGLFRESLRVDPRGYQIEDDDAAEATLQTLEAFGLILAEMTLHRFADLAGEDAATRLDLRALATTAGTVGMTRLAYMEGRDRSGAPRRDHSDNPMASAAAERMRAIMDWLLAWPINNPQAPPKIRAPRSPNAAVKLALADLAASASYFYRRAANAGTSGGGRKRTMARATTRRRQTN